MGHAEEQAAARAAKAAKKAENIKREQERVKLSNSLRALRKMTISKADLLELLQQEGLISEEATRIIATGHGPEDLTITYTKEELEG